MEDKIEVTFNGTKGWFLIEEWKHMAAWMRFREQGGRSEDFQEYYDKLNDSKKEERECC